MKEYPKPTVQQAIDSWRLVCELVELGYPHNFQREEPYIRNYMYAVSDLVEVAYKIKNREKLGEPRDERNGDCETG